MERIDGDFNWIHGVVVASVYTSRVTKRGRIINQEIFLGGKEAKGSWLKREGKTVTIIEDRSEEEGPPVEEKAKHFCPDLRISSHNGYIYCGKCPGGAYCVYSPGSRGSDWECPRGYKGYPEGVMTGNPVGQGDPEPEEEDEIPVNMTLDSFTKKRRK